MAEMKEGMNDFTEMVESGQSMSVLETVSCEENVNPQPVTFSQTTCAGKEIMIRQEEDSVTNSEEILNVDLSCCSEEVKFAGTSIKSKKLYSCLDTRNQNSVAKQLNEGVVDDFENSKKYQYMPQDLRDNSESMSSFEGKQEVHHYTKLKKDKNMGTEKLKFPSDIESKLERSSESNPCSFVPCSSDSSTLCSGGLGKLYDASSHSVDSKVVSKDKVNSVFQENFSDELDKITHHHLQRIESSNMNNLCEVKEVQQPHQSEDEYDHVTNGLVYVITSFPGSGIDQDEYNNNFIEGCSCSGVCSEGCSCISRYGCPYFGGKIMVHHESKPIFECNDTCGCLGICPNRLTQRGPITGLKITKIPGKGYGVTTSQFIPKHSFVCEYAGEYISVEEAQRRFSKQKDQESNYILILREYTGDVSGGAHITIIDPTVAGNIGRYINHSCDPNLVVVPVRVSNMVPLAALFASKDIFPGEELCYDYNSSQNELRSSASNFVDRRNLHSPNIPDVSVNVEKVIGNEILSTVHQSENVGITSSEMSKVSSEDTYPLHSSTDSSSSCRKVLKPCLCKATNCKRFLPVINTLF